MIQPAVILHNLSKTFVPEKGRTLVALDRLDAELPANMIIGVVGPDAAGKTTLLRLLAGLLTPSEGEALLFGKTAVASGGGSLDFVGYMPQKFGLYEDLSVMDNLRLHARLRDIRGEERDRRFERLLGFTDLARFQERLAGRLSGGMKQKLGLACALIGTPRLLLLDEPGVGVDPQSRRELWRMVGELTADGMSVIWSTAYMDEAEQCARVLMLDGGKLIYAGSPADFTATVKGRTFFLNLSTLPEQATAPRQGLAAWSDDPRCLDVQVQGSRLRLLFANTPEASEQQREGLSQAPPRLEDAYMNVVGGMGREQSPFLAFPPVWSELADKDQPLIEACSLTKRFGNFTAAADISFSVPAGRIFGLLGPNGAGKSTTFRMLCGLSRPSSGTCFVAGVNLLRAPGQARSRLGYMAQKFSLYGDLTVLQNISLFGKLYNMKSRDLSERSDMLVTSLGLRPWCDTRAQDMPLGQKQRLALLCAMLHGPKALFLDEPTSGVDPRTRREFWKHINALTSIGVAVLVTTHFMEEAEYCDHLALIYRGRMIASGTPDSLKQDFRSPALPDPTMEDAFIACIEEYNREYPL